MSRCPLPSAARDSPTVRVALGVATQGSHRPVLAQLTHTVPPVMVSPPTVHRRAPNDAIRWPGGDVRTRYCALGTVPTNESMTRRPLAVFPSLHRVLLGRVPRLPRYYEDAQPSCHPFRRTSFPAFGDTRDVPRASLPSDLEVPTGWAWSFGSALPLPTLRGRRRDFPRS